MAAPCECLLCVYPQKKRRQKTANNTTIIDRRALRGARRLEAHPVIETAPGEEAQVDYGEGALTLYPGTDRYSRPTVSLPITGLVAVPISSGSCARTSSTLSSCSSSSTNSTRVLLSSHK